MTKTAKKNKPGSEMIAAPNSDLASFERLRNELDSELAIFEEELSAFAVDNQSDLELLAEITATAKGHLKRVKTWLKQAVAPYESKINEAKDLARPVSDRLVAIEFATKRLVGQYHMRKEQEQAKALALAAQANKNGQVVKAEVALVKAAAATVESVKGMSVRYTIDIEIDNEDLVPDEWWEIDTNRLGKFVRATNGEVPIPGVIYHKRPIVSSTSK